MHNDTQVEQQGPERLLMITGCSGAGKSSVLKALEDNGYYCIDNMPLELLDSFLSVSPQAEHIGKRIALGIDIRTVSSIEQYVQMITKLKQRMASRFSLIFMSASTSVLIKRFQETRRKHPLAHGTTLTQAIGNEKKLLEPLCSGADHHIATDSLSIGQLRRLVSAQFVPHDAQQILVTFMSFGFKYGVPLESNFIWDVRSLPNPYFVPGLRALTGTDSVIQDYLFGKDSVKDYWQRLYEFIQFAIGAAHQEGRSSITVAVGCTGGRHRSVALIERLGACEFAQATNLITHRDISRDAYSKEKL